MRRLVGRGGCVVAGLAGVLALVVPAGCDRTADRSALAPSGSGRVLFQLPDNTVQLVEARPSGAVLNLSARLGVRGTATLSLNGRYVAVSTADGCVAVSTGDFTRLEKVTSHGACVAGYPESMHLSDDGTVLVFNASGTHQRDIFVVRRSGPDDWSQPRDLTASGPFQVNKLPRLNPDASRVVFDCGDGPDSDEGTSLCEVGTGADPVVRTVLREPVGSGEQAWTAFHSPNYRPDGGLVFECHHPHEELVCALPAGSVTPVRLTAAGVSNDNSPCAFPDGRVASLLDTGTHVLRLTASDGTQPVTIEDRFDILDAGIYCGGIGSGTPKS
jgi:hypothetical protein